MTRWITRWMESLSKERCFWSMATSSSWARMSWSGMSPIIKKATPNMWLALRAHHPLCDECLCRKATLLLWHMVQSYLKWSPVILYSRSICGRILSTYQCFRRKGTHALKWGCNVRPVWRGCALRRTWAAHPVGMSFTWFASSSGLKTKRTALR